MDGSELASQIIQFTKVNVTPAGEIAPGEPVIVEVIPGYAPLVPPNVSGQLTGTGTGTVELPAPTVADPNATKTVEIPIELVLDAAELVLNAADVTFSVEYSITETDENGNEKEYSNFSLESMVPEIEGETPDSQPMMVKLTVLPPVVPEHEFKPLKTLQLHVKITVDVVGNKKTGEVPPIDLPVVPIPIPTLLILRGDKNDDGGPNGTAYPSSCFIVVTRSGSALASASDAINALNTAIDTLNKVKDIPGSFVLDLLLGGLTDAVDDVAGYVPYAQIFFEEVPYLTDVDDDGDGFDDEPRLLVLIGPVGTKVTLYSGEDYNNYAAGENLESTLEITQSLAGDIGIGVLRIPALDETDWQNKDADDEQMYDIESCNFGESKYEP